MKVASFLFLFFLYTIGLAQDNPMGIFKYQTDVGNPKKAGSVHYDAGTQTYTVKGGGYNIWYNCDEFHYVYNTVKGNFILTANFQLTGPGINMHRKIGWMVRESTDAQASHVSAVNHGDGLTLLQWRPLRGAYMRDPEDEYFLPNGTCRSFNLNAVEKNSLCA
jgi:TolB protein